MRKLDVGKNSHLYVYNSNIDCQHWALPDCFLNTNKMLRDCQVRHCELVCPVYIPKDLIQLDGYYSPTCEGGFAIFNYRGKISILQSNDEAGWKLFGMMFQGGFMQGMPFTTLYKKTFKSNI